MPVVMELAVGDVRDGFAKDAHAFLHTHEVVVRVEDGQPGCPTGKIGVNLEVEEVGGVGLGIVSWIEPWRDQNDFADFLVFVFAQPTNQKTGTTAMANEYGLGSGVEPLELFLPNVVAWLPWFWWLDSNGKDVIDLQLF